MSVSLLRRGRSNQRRRLLHSRVSSTEPRTREPATIRVLSVNRRRLLPTATKSTPATGVKFCYGTGDALFQAPSNVAVDGSGNVFVTDTKSYGIQKFACP